ncbi:MAG: FGGY family carbohydrate kinase, partial [Oscillospiraceae bacterium]
EFMMDEVSKIVSDSELYERTGIQKQSYNTIYQLFAIHKSNPEIIENATTFLMTPEYFNFLLTGEKKNEYTIASTTGLLNPRTHEWDMELIEKLGYKKELFKPLNAPKTVVGGFTKEVQDEVGFDCTVILPPTHDTASAVLSVPATTLDNVYISSGTWSLMGVESMTPNCTPESQSANLTNEGGIDYRFRYLKNIMGLWIIQFIKREYGEKYSFNDLEILARENADFNSKIDVNDSRFLSPKSMIAAVQSYCSEHNMRVPETVGEIMQCAYISLAYSYSETVKEIEKITKHTYQAINIVGGGSQDGYLNELTAKATGKTVYTGPVEATALGNILTQMLSQETVKSVDEAREIIRKSFDIKKIEI